MVRNLGMMNESYLLGLAGGALIGNAATLMLWLNGCVLGISGALNGVRRYMRGDRAWRLALLTELMVGPAVVGYWRADSFLNVSGRSVAEIGFAGLLVGIGTVMGSGCTSGHGVCGISCLAPRSILATLSFIAAGIASLTLLRVVGA